MKTLIARCYCKHSFQDKIYGKNQRLHNVNNKGAKCTVCLNQINITITKDKTNER